MKKTALVITTALILSPLVQLQAHEDTHNQWMEEEGAPAGNIKTNMSKKPVSDMNHDAWMEEEGAPAGKIKKAMTKKPASDMNHEVWMEEGDMKSDTHDHSNH